MDIWIRNGTEIEVEAVRLTEDNHEAVLAWCGGFADPVEEINPEHPEEMQPALNLRTVAGMQRASLHMYVVKYGGAFFAEHNRVFESYYTLRDKPMPPMESAGDAARQRGFADPFGRSTAG